MVKKNKQIFFISLSLVQRYDYLKNEDSLRLFFVDLNFNSCSNKVSDSDVALKMIYSSCFSDLLSIDDRFYNLYNKNLISQLNCLSSVNSFIKKLYFDWVVLNFECNVFYSGLYVFKNYMLTIKQNQSDFLIEVSGYNDTEKQNDLNNFKYTVEIFNNVNFEKNSFNFVHSDQKITITNDVGGYKLKITKIGYKNIDNIQVLADSVIVESSKSVKPHP